VELWRIDEDVLGAVKLEAKNKIGRLFEEF
jgi:hypothetical protein